MDTKDLQNFLDDEGRLTSWPAKPTKQMLALQFLAGKLEWDCLYTEQEINELLTKFHLFEDAALLRRELYMKHFLDRKADGSAYWKTERQLPMLWKTERLTVRNATEEDLPELRKVYDECAYIGELTGYHDDAKDPMLAEFRRELLPPNGKKELHRLQTIFASGTQDVVAYLISYHGFPDHEIFWIAAFAVRPAFQRQKFGREVIGSLTKQVEELGGYSRMGIAVGVGNDPAMKFWSTCGFTDVIKTEDHGTHADQWIVKQL
ncbi:MAG: hypothetical protein Greene041619_1108 [Candidatus Peregrinibacteria bacterium Greene0416_19]|nr:MAG: hypothetical protein Greene041619_1108 [Candidatus Peregrinibacteria bacterium Greene0416_19]